jgi:ferredoxin
MAYVVTETCLDCKYTSCAAVCPVEAFHEGPDMLFIDPDTCVDCNACRDECPVKAIFPDFEVPADQKQYIKINAEEAVKFPVIVKTKPALLGPRCKGK